MSLTPGEKLGPYEILTLLGAGGMGQVYLANDSRLHRKVAVKILPSHLADDSERRERFEREARVVAGLSHSHICAIYDVGVQETERGRVHFLVMEYLQGETLAQRLKKGALPLPLVLRYAVDIAEALAAAHESGVVHRDLKPSNVMLVDSGAKLLDFGLAKPTQIAGSRSLDSMQSTAGRDLTSQGAILGTLPYMSPEQLEGKAVDARTDLFAFGAIVYEMMTGRRAFEGESQASLIAAILERDPPSLATHQPLAPPALERVVMKCLAKEPSKRWQTAQDLADELRWVSESRVEYSPTIRRGQGARAAVYVSGAVLIAMALGVLAWRLMRRTPSPPFTIRYVISEPLTLGGNLAISPDGTRLVYQAYRNGKPVSLLRELNELEAKTLAVNLGNPFFSPDGRWVGFADFDSGLLKKMSLSGGAPVALCEVGFPSGAWGDDDSIIFSPGFTGGISRVPASGGKPEVLTVTDRSSGEKSHRFPILLPGGTAILFTTVTSDMSSIDDARIEVISLKNRERRVLVPGGWNARYAPSGHLVYEHAGSVEAVPFDLDTLTVTGLPVRVVEGLQPSVGGRSSFTFSANGTLVYVPRDDGPVGSLLAWVDRSGARESIPLGPDMLFTSPRLSPDGGRLAVEIVRLNDEIWIYDFERGTFTRLVSAWDNVGPVWTMDGTRVSFGSPREGPFNVFWIPADGSGAPEKLTDMEGWPESFSPDGRYLALTTGDLWILPMEGERKAWPFLQSPANEDSARFSPDGRFLAYTSNESGRDEVYVRPFPGPGPRWQVSADGGSDPMWSRDGREMFYSRAGTGKVGLFALPVSTTPTFGPGDPKALFEVPADTRIVDVSADGQRFLVSEPAPPPTELRVVVNWFTELERLVPPH